MSEGDLSFGEGEELLIRPGLLPSEGWWLGRSCADGRCGYVPRYVVDRSWRARCLHATYDAQMSVTAIRPRARHDGSTT